jgi:hypothetical protein
MGNARCDVHRVAKAQSFFDFAAAHQVFNGVCDVHEAAAAFHFEPEMLGQ